MTHSILKALADLEEAANLATKGEWYVAEIKEWSLTTPRQMVRSRDGVTDHAICEAFGGTGPRPNDARFIVAAGNSMRPAVEACRVLATALENIRIETGLDDPEFGNFTPLQFAARHGLIDIRAKQALADCERILGGGK